MSRAASGQPGQAGLVRARPRGASPSPPWALSTPMAATSSVRRRGQSGPHGAVDGFEAVRGVFERHTPSPAPRRRPEASPPRSRRAAAAPSTADAADQKSTATSLAPITVSDQPSSEGDADSSFAPRTAGRASKNTSAPPRAAGAPAGLRSRPAPAPRRGHRRQDAQLGARVRIVDTCRRSGAAARPPRSHRERPAATALLHREAVPRGRVAAFGAFDTTVYGRCCSASARADPLHHRPLSPLLRSSSVVVPATMPLPARFAALAWWRSAGSPSSPRSGVYAAELPQARRRARRLPQLLQQCAGTAVARRWTAGMA